jgi:F-type H+-transporting ATPase subunit b
MLPHGQLAAIWSDTHSQPEANMRHLLVLGLTIAICATGASRAFGDEHGGGGTPNPLDIAFDTALWAVVIFGALLLVLYYKAWGPILEGLQKREETIRSSLEEAKRTRDEMAAMQANFQKEMANAQKQIPLMMEQARKDADEMVNQMRSKAAADIQSERDRLRHEVEIAKDQAIKQMWEQAAQLATLISAKVIGRSLNEEDHRRLVDEGLQEMRQAARN